MAKQLSSKIDPLRVQKFVEKMCPVIEVPGVSEDYKHYARKLPEWLAKTKAPQTETNYYLSFQRFATFCEENGRQPLPSAVADILVYFMKVGEESESSATVLQARSAIRHYNVIHDASTPPPTDDPLVGLVVEAITRQYVKPVTKKLPTSVELVKRIVHLLVNKDVYRSRGDFRESITDWRLAVQTLFKFVCFARFEETVELRKNNFKLLPSGDLEVTFFKGKNYNSFHPRSCVIAKLGGPFCPVRLISKYWERLNYPAGVNGVFLPAVQSKFARGQSGRVRLQVPQHDRAISYDACRKQFKEVLERLGEDSRLYGLHSNRLGGLTKAANAGLPWPVVGAHGRWHPGSKVPQTYHRQSLQLRKQVTQSLGLGSR